MKYVASLFVFAWFQAVATPSLAEQTLRLQVAVKGENVELRALDYPSMKPHVESAGSIETLQSIYFALECFVSSDCPVLKAPHEPDPKTIDPKDLVPILIEEGEKLLGPFTDLIDAADEISFQIDMSLLKSPFDLLYLHGSPLFTSKKISFTVGAARSKGLPTPDRNWVGLLVSDETADPDRAIFALEKKFPGSHSFDIEQFGLSSLQGIEPVDFVAISGHGSVNGNGEGYISLGNGEKLHAGSLAKLRPKLVYFDSCNLGISADHLMELQVGGTIYAVAPILSNEAGDSSTATIEIFFSELEKGSDPTSALFLARSRLYERYASDDMRTALWRAFPFRVYRLN